MQLSTAVASAAVILAVALVAGHAQGDDQPAPKVVTQHDKAQEREAKRRGEIAEQEKRRSEFARRCIRPLDVPANLEACRTVYRRI